ncbi:MAG: hypothetical protein COB37_03460 [Kordiimonadales bacterium]|nr:MAG: hypothetical protein COB37_03460 [Kordiimonadales bacterium]
MTGLTASQGVRMPLVSDGQIQGLLIVKRRVRQARLQASPKKLGITARIIGVAEPVIVTVAGMMATEKAVDVVFQ